MTKWKGEVASYAPHAAELVSSTGGVSVGVLFAALLLGAAGPASAADRYWDVNQTAAGSGGTGVWNLGNLFWSPNSSGTLGPYNQPWDNAALDHAIFAGTAGTVTLGAPITANALTFSTGGYTIAGSGVNTLTLGGTTPTITTTAGTTTIGAVIAGSNGFTKAGAATLFLTGANTFSGGITLSGGVLRANNNAAFGAAGNTIATTANATLTVDSGTTNRTVSIAGGTSLTVAGLGVGSAQFTGSGNLSAANGVTLSNDSNNFTGTVQLNGQNNGVGNVLFTSVRNVGEASSLGAGGTITFTGGNQYSDNISYIGTGDSSNRDWVMAGSTLRRFNNSGTGALTLTGNINMVQATQFNAASADFNLLGVLSGAAPSVSFTAAAGRNVTLGGANTFAGSVGLSGGGVINVSVLANAGLASSLGQGSAIAINDATLRYTGGATSTDRTWVLSNNAALQNDGTGGLTLTGAMAFDPVASIDTLNLGGSYAGENTIASNISDSGRIVMNGAGTWVLSGDNTYTGTTTVENGTLRAGSATAFGAVAGITVNSGTLDLNGFDLTAPTLTGTGGTIELGTGNLTVNVATGTSSSFAGSIQGSGGFTKSGGGTQTLTGASTYTGDTNMSGGTLALDFSPAGGPAADIISSDSALNMSGGTVQITGAAGEANSQSFDGLNITAGSNRITASAGSGGSMTVDLGAVTRSGGQIDFGIGSGATIGVEAGTVLGGWATVNGTDYADVDASNNIVAFTNYDLKDDAGTWNDGDIVTDTAGAANTAFFGTVSDAGGDNVVQLGGLRYTAAANSAINVGAGQTLGVDGTIIVASSVGSVSQAISGGSVRGAAGGVLGIQQNGAGTFTINSTIVDNGGATGLNVGGIGTGNVVLGNAANTYTGATWVTRGRLTVATLANGGVASSIGASSADSSNLVLEGGTLSYTGGSVTTDRGLTVMRSGAVTGGVIQVTQSSTNLTFGGEIVSPDGGGLTKTGSGTLTLTNANNSYTGATVVSGGGTLSVATLANGGANSSIGASSSDSANLFIEGGSTLQYTGGSVTSDRGFTLNGAAGGIIDVTNAGTELTFGGTVAGLGGAPLTKAGAGTLTLSGVNTYRGQIRVNDGTLRAGSTQAFGLVNLVVMADTAGATLDLDGFDNRVAGLSGGGTNGGNVLLGDATLTIGGATASYSGAISGAGGLIKDNTNVQTMVGCSNSYTGSTRIQAGVLSVDCIRDGGEASGIGASDAAAANLVLTTNGTLEYTGGTVTTDRGFHLAGGWGGIDVAEATATLEFTGNVTNASGGGLVKDGAGALKLSGSNTYGATLLREGTLIAGSTQAFGTGGMTVYAGTTLDLANNSNSVGFLDDENDIAGGTVLLGSADLTITNGGAWFYGTINGTGGLIKNGGGAQGLGGCGNTYSGRTAINAGWIYADCLKDGGLNSSIGSSSADASNLVIGGTSAAGLDYRGSENTSTNRRFTMGNTAYLYSSGTGTINFTSTNAITHTGSGTRQLRLGGTNTGTNILAAEIVNNGASAVTLIKEQAGTWRVSNQNNSFTGATTIGGEGGVLEVTKLANGGENSSIGASLATAGNLVIGTNGTLRYVGAGDSTNRLFTLGTGTTIIESSGTGAVNFTDSGGLMGFAGTGARIFTLGGTYAGDNVMGVTIRDQNGTAQTSLAKNDAGTWILTANNTYTGNTVINDGKLIIGNGGTVGNVGTGKVILAFDTGTLGFNRSDIFNFAGEISGPGTIEQMGEGTTVLTAVNTAGSAKISEGRLQVNGSLTLGTAGSAGTIVFEDDEATTLVVNGTLQGFAGGPAVITGDASANIITVNAGGSLTANGNLGGGSDVVTVSGALATGAAQLNLADGNDTLVLNDTAVFTGAGVNAGAGTGDTLQVNTSSARTLAGSQVTGFEALTKTLGGTLTLTGDHSFTAGTTISAGVLQIGDGTATGTLAGNVLNNGMLVFNRDGASTFAGNISGSGGLSHIDSGTTTLTGTNSYKGATSIAAGTLIINGDQSGATGPTSVANGATLGGNGTIGGNVTVAGGGSINPGDAGSDPGTLTINGNLTLAGTSTLNMDFGQANLPGGPLNDLIDVEGDLVLDGTLNVNTTPGGSFGPGVYRVINYSGDLTDRGLEIGTIPSPTFSLQTNVANQINLINTAGLSLTYWDGPGNPNDDVIQGGTGVWQNAPGNQNWTDQDGDLNAAWANSEFAIFMGTGGTVTIDNGPGAVTASGMQFAVDGYTIDGQTLTLVSAPSTTTSIIRVGDGSSAGASMTATIDAVVAGDTTLVKDDLGTLVLNGANTYTGGTRIDGGVLQIAADENLGDAAGALALDGGTLRNTAAIDTTRGISLDDEGGAFETDADLVLAGVIDGVGSLTKTGAGTLTLGGTNTYSGGTVIDEGTVSISQDANLGASAGGVTFNGGRLQNTASFTTARTATLNAGGGTFQTDADLTWTGVIGGAGGLTKTGSETLILTAANTYAGGTTVAGGTLQLGNGGSTGSIAGDVALSGGATLAFNRDNEYTFAGLIAGSGGIEQIGSGVTILTADNSYGGPTRIADGTLIINGDQTDADGDTTVESGGTLGGIGTVGGNVTVESGGMLSPGELDAAPGTLTIARDLTLLEGAVLQYSFGEADVEGGPFNDLTRVNGDLVLDGSINVDLAPGGNFGPGIYRIISYTGSLTDNVLDVGAAPGDPDELSVQTSVANQVNLVSEAGEQLQYWDVTPKDDDQVNGGTGVWQNAGTLDNWTDETGGQNAEWDGGTFAIFAGQSGTVTVESTAVDPVLAAGMQFAIGGYTIAGDTLTLVDNTPDDGSSSIIRVGDGTADGAGYIATISAQLAGTTQLVKTDLGTLVLGGNNTYTGGTRLEGGTLQVSSNANLGDVEGDLTFAGGVLHTTASFATGAGRNIVFEGDGAFLTDAGTTLTLDGTISGPGDWTKAGTGAVLLTGAASNDGTTTIAQGMLRAGAANVFSANSGYLVEEAGTLDLGGFDQTVAALDNAGIVRLNSAGGTPGATLTVQGNYAGDDGTIYLNAALNDDTSSTDLLAVLGDTSGSTTLIVANVGGAGAATVDGIKIVDVAGASNGVFVLQGDYVLNGEQAIAAGAYGYTLQKNGISTPGDGDWYLRSITADNGGPIFQPGVPLYEAYAGALQAFNQLGTLQQRLGNRSWAGGMGLEEGADALTAGAIDGSGIWARIEAAHGHFEPETSTSSSDYDTAIWRLQAGLSMVLTENAGGSLLGGLSFTYGSISADVESPSGIGSIDSTGYGIGGTLTWYGSAGFYVDGQAQAIWYDSDLFSKTANTLAADSNDGTGYALSIEAGKKFAFAPNWSITPQAQLAWSSVDFQSFTDPFDADVSLDESDSLIGRLGITVDYESLGQDGQGRMTRTHVYSIGNLYYDFADGSTVNVGGTRLTSANEELWGGLGIGGAFNWADDKYSVYGEAQAKTGLENFGDSHVLGATVGFRASW